MSAGYIFFGSAIAISDQLVAAARAMLAEDAATMTGTSACPWSHANLSSCCTSLLPLLTTSEVHHIAESGTLSTLRAGRRVGSSGALAEDGKLPLEQRAKSAVAESPRFVVLDFRCAARQPGILAFCAVVQPIILLKQKKPRTRCKRSLCANSGTDLNLASS